MKLSSYLINWPFAVTLAGCVASAISLHAQRVTSIADLRIPGDHVSPSSEISPISASTALDARATALPIRLVTAVGGTVVGFFVGGTVGYQLLSHDCGGCDDPGLDAFIYGALVGVPVGAALGAAAPRLGSVCPFGERTGRALLGAGAGGAVGFLVGMVSTEGAIAITFPTFSVAGALGSLGRCWRAVPE